MSCQATVAAQSSRLGQIDSNYAAAKVALRETEPQNLLFDEMTLWFNIPKPEQS
jgi:hypothetical protein